MVFQIVHAYKGYWPDPTGGVAEVIAMVTANRDPRFEHSILVARSRGRGRRYIENGVPVHAVGSLGMLSSMPMAPSYPFALARARRSADLIVHHAPFPLTDLGVTVGPRGRAAMIVHWHAEIVRAGPLLRVLQPFLQKSLRDAHRIIVAHEAIARNSPVLRDHSQKCVVIPYAVDAAYWADLSDQQRKQAAALRSRFPRLIVSTGRLVAYKGYDVLLRALARIDAALIVIGEGPLRQTLTSTIEELGLQDRVMLVGHQERADMKVFLHAARVFAFPSVNEAESFGLAQLEAMASGLPVVNTELTTAVPHVARHQLEGLTVTPGDTSALAEALDRLLNDENLASALGTAGLARVQRDFDRQKFLTAIGAQYEDAIRAKN